MIEDNLKKLIQFQTVSEKDTEEFERLYDFVNQELTELDLTKTEFKNGEFKSVLWTYEANPKILLTAHVDVVPGSEEIFEPKIEGNKLIGRGAFDMKFAIAVFIEIMKNLLKEKKLSVGLLLTPDEEIGGMNGTRYVLENAYLKPLCVFLPDGGNNFSIESGSKGVLQIRLISKGEKAHGSRPWLGVNAIDKLIENYLKLKDEFPNPDKEEWVTTINAGQIQGGDAVNQIPGQAVLDLDIRYPDKRTKEKIVTFLEDNFRQDSIFFEILTEGELFEVNKDNQYLKNYIKAVEEIALVTPEILKSAGSSDARFYSPLDIPVIVSRPKGGGQHAEDEWIDLDSLNVYYKVVREFIKSSL